MGSRPAAAPTPATPLSPVEIEYDRPQQSLIARRAFRVLVALTLLNTLLFVGYFVAPTVFTFTKQKWQQRQAAAALSQQQQAAAVAAVQRRVALQQAQAQNEVAERAKAEARAAQDRRRHKDLTAALAAGRTYAFSKGQVVYERDPVAAAALLAGDAPGTAGATEGGGERTYVAVGRLMPAIQPPVHIAPAAPWKALVPLLDANADPAAQAAGSGNGSNNGDKGLAALGSPIFLHERTAARAARPRLVAVLLTADHLYDLGANGGGARSGVILAAVSIQTDAAPGQRPDVKDVRLMLTPSGQSTLDYTAPGGRPGVRSSKPLRIHAGQSDPGDPSRFTIDALFENRPVTLTGQLMSDDSIEFTAGPGTEITATGDGRQYWSLDPQRPASTR